MMVANEIIKCNSEMDPELDDFLADFYPYEAEVEGGVDENIPNLVDGEENILGEWIANFQNIDDYVWMLKVTPSIMKGMNVLVRSNFLIYLSHAL